MGKGVEANWRACEGPEGRGKVVNIGPGARISLNQTLTLLREISGNHLQTKFEPARDGDIRDSQADITLAREILQYQPTVDFPEGLRRTFEWYKECDAKARAKQKNAE